MLGFLSLSFGQLIESLNLSSTDKFSKVEGIFIKKYSNQNGFKFECYEFNSMQTNISYFPIQENIDCGYFEINGTIFKDNPSLIKLGCDLDYGSFQVFKLNLKSERFILINSIASVSGSATRRVFNNLFQIDVYGIKYFPLTSLYGTENNFGDFNQDGWLDYLETTYDKFDPNYKTIFTTLKNGQFLKDETKFFRFKMISTGNKFKVMIIEKEWW